MNVDCINTIIKALLINFLTYYIGYKIIAFKVKNCLSKFIFLVIIIINSIFYLICRNIFPVLESNIIIYFFQSVLFSKLVQRKVLFSFGIVFISTAFSYLISTILSPLIFAITYFLGINNSVVVSFIIAIVSIIFIYKLFKINRLKNGIEIISSKANNEYLEIFFITISTIIIIIYGLLSNLENKITVRIYIYLLVLGIVSFIMIQKSLILVYKQKLLENTLKEYQENIELKDKQIKKLSEEKFKISKLNHEFYNRQRALELKVENALKNMDFEIGEEFDLRGKIAELSEEYTNKIKENKTRNKLPQTDIEEIDDMFEYMQSECEKNKIEFILQINGNIHYLINNIIDKNKLVTLIGDHLRDAIIAVNYSDNKYKSILAILGIKDECYEFCIYDSGIEFEIGTFENLGLKPATTHKDSGGTGIGFITTFETLKLTKGSLIIEEKNRLTENNYTKAVKFRFDNKNESKIISYRAEEIKENINRDRLIIQKF